MYLSRKFSYPFSTDWVIFFLVSYTCSSSTFLEVRVNINLHIISLCLVLCCTNGKKLDGSTVFAYSNDYENDDFHPSLLVRVFTTSHSTVYHVGQPFPYRFDDVVRLYFYVPVCCVVTHMVICRFLFSVEVPGRHPLPH